MPKIRLTSAAVDRLAAPSAGQVEYYDSHLPAFGVRISYSGTKAWFVMTRVHGRLTRFTLGRYPPMALADARDKAREVLQHGKSGRDPRQLQADERRRAEKERRTTFEATAELFLERYVERHLRSTTAREYRRILQGSDTQHWRSRPLSTISRDDAVDLLSRIHERGSPAAANRALAYLSKFFNWCLEQDLITASPTSRVRALSASRSRDRVLSTEELKILWRAIGELPGVFGRFFAVLLLTGQRRAEVADMRWSELRNLESGVALWEVPKERTKNGQTHLVPLAPAVLAQLSLIPRTGSFVFTTTGATGISGFSKAKRQLDSVLRRSSSDCNHPPLAAWTLHDLRRTMVTIMNERLAIPPHVVEAVVNHVSGPAKRGVAGVYNRALYLDDRPDALWRWAVYVTCSGEKQN